MNIQLSIGSRIRKSPFFESARQDGMVSASVYNHMILPTSFGDQQAEYDALVNRAAMWDVGAERQISIKGADAVGLAGYLTGRNLGDLKIGQGKYAPICNFSGVIINDPILLLVEKDEIWLSIADSDIGLWASAIAGQLKLDVCVSELDVSPLAIQGPLAEKIVVDLFGEWVSELKYFGFRRTTFDGIPIILAKSGWSKQGGFELYLCDGEKGKALWDAVKEAGRSYGIGMGAPSPIERLESGLVSVGADTDANCNPFELGLEKFIDLDQATDFIGKSALLEIKEKGPKRRFVGLVIDPPKLIGFNEHKLIAYQRGQAVGYLSATAYSPRLRTNIAVGLLNVEAIDSGKPIDFFLGNQGYQGEVRAFPLVTRSDE